MELLQRYGVRPEDIHVKVANALHRMWTRNACWPNWTAGGPTVSS